jgi:hypothetical protein
VLLIWQIDCFHRYEQSWEALYYSLATERLESLNRRRANGIAEGLRNVGLLRASQWKGSVNFMLCLRHKFQKIDPSKMTINEEDAIGFGMSQYSETETGAINSFGSFAELVAISIPFARKIRTHWSKEGF